MKIYILFFCYLFVSGCAKNQIKYPVSENTPECEYYESMQIAPMLPTAVDKLREECNLSKSKIN